MRQFASTIVLLLLPGCVYVPLFNLPGPGSCDPRGRIGTPDTDKRLKIDRSNRDYVVKTLGQPDAESLDGRRIVYTGDRLQGVWWILPFHALFVGTRTWTELQFDGGDVLTGVDSISYTTGNPKAAWFVGGDPTEVDLPWQWRERYPSRDD